MDDGDFQSISSQLDGLDEQSTTLVHVEEEQLTYMKKLTNEVEGNSKAIKTIAETLKDTILEVKNTNFTIWNEINQLKRKLRYQARISSLIREIELTLSLVDKQLVQLQEALDVTATGHLSSMLIKPAKLNMILKEIVTRLPNGLSLITDIELDKVYGYYKIVKVHAMSSKNAIRLIIEIPLLKSDNKYFELFRVRPLPYFDNDLARFVVVSGEASYFAISNDRQWYALLEESQLRDCNDEVYGICSIDIPLLPAAEGASCTHAMFAGEDSKAHQYCQRDVLRNYTTPTLYPGPKGEFWIFSLPHSIMSTWQCTFPNEIPLRSTPHTSTRTLEGTGIIYNTQNCYIYSKYFKISPHSEGQTYFKVQFNHIIVPAISDILTSVERFLFKNQSSYNESNISNLEEIINNHSERADVISIERLQRKLIEIRKPQVVNNLFLTYLTVIIIVIVITSFLTVSCVLQCRFTKQNIQSSLSLERETPAVIAAIPTAFNLIPDDNVPTTTRYAQGHLTSSI